MYKDSLYVFGGWDGRKPSDELYKFDFGTYSPLSHYVFLLVLQTHTNAFVLLHAATNRWSIIKAANGPCCRFSHTCVVYNDSMFIFGGFGGEQRTAYLGDLYKFNFSM